MKITVLWHSNCEESEPLGAFESHAAAISHVIENYGPCCDAELVNPEEPVVYLSPSNWWELELVLYRVEVGSARVLDVKAEDMRTRVRS